ncbi:MAG: enoyl-CoA hydratase/isomerase family protein [Candidatus Helarchaeota archaeon]
MVNLLLEEKGRIGIIKINRPKVKNALNKESLLELRNAIRAYRKNKKIRAILITGIDNSFSAGMDLKSVQGLTSEKVQWVASLGRLVLLEINNGIEYEIDPVEFFEQVLKGHEIKYEIGENWKPIIAAINGYALGGGLELACACDFRFASKNATLGYPEIDLRIFPSWGGTQFTTKILGIPKSEYLIFTCERIDSNKAREIGLINDVFNDADLFNKSFEFARKLTKKDLNILKNVKILIEQSFGNNLIKGLALEYKFTKNWK